MSRPFLPNGCSRVPDGAAGVEWKGCCDLHDLAYFTGGSLRDKARADWGLAMCIADRHERQGYGGRGLAVGVLYFTGVTLFGWTPWHWSYTKKPMPSDLDLRRIADLSDGQRAALRRLS